MSEEASHPDHTLNRAETDATEKRAIILPIFLSLSLFNH